MDHNTIALKRNETTGKAVRMPSGDVLVAGGVSGSDTFPATIRLEMRFKNESGDWVNWIDTETELTSASKTDIVGMSSVNQYRLVASAAGASVQFSLLVQSMFRV